MGPRGSVLWGAAAIATGCASGTNSAASNGSEEGPMASSSPTAPAVLEARPSASIAVGLTATSTAAPTAAAPIGSSAPRPANTCSADERAYGSTCCARPAEPGERSPGQTILDCHGPKIGQPCSSKSDCDVVCSCDDPNVLLGPGRGKSGPSDGTKGAKGVCGARIQVGVSMCEINEQGVVTHVILD